MEVNRIAEALPVAEAAGSGLESLDAAVGAFGMAVVHAHHDGIENAPEVLLDRPGCCFALKIDPGGMRQISWTDLRH